MKKKTQLKKNVKPKSASQNELKQLRAQVKRLSIQRPFKDVGGIIGRASGIPYAEAIGKWLGSGIGSIFGSGDYVITGPQPTYNILTSSTQIPQFGGSTHSNIVCHREYLGDISGTSNFTVLQYPLNPGNTTTFPWLSTVAQNYQEYRFHGLIFEFRPLITDFASSGAPGVVVMATNYNAAALPFSSKIAMEGSEFATSVKPTVGLMHAIECASTQTILPERFIRTGAVPSGQDPKLFDLGLFQFGSQQNTPGIDLGELWVSYCVEFYKPALPATIGGNLVSAHITRANTATNVSNPFGLIAGNIVGNLGATASSTLITFPGYSGNSYFVSMSWAGTNGTIADPVFTITNAIYPQYFRGSTNAIMSAPQPGQTANLYTSSFILVATLSAPGVIGIGLSTWSGGPTGTMLFDCIITELSSTITA
jgi:hypothetical protein